MARERKPEPREPCGLTVLQLKVLAKRLDDTRLDVFSASQKLLSARITGDSIFEDLARVCNIRLCPRCGIWKQLSAFDDVDGMCTGCVDTIELGDRS